ncbi:MAG: glycosyltransferase [Firmicutes bacterium HGW-Firmicutes-16]|nr:MAG: glycosyltransferase [Firmicutes bacterium HGW-Firmicutes-16]
MPTKLKTDHIFRMTDDTGMLQHSNYGVPDLSKGYTSVDNARALIMAVKLFEQTHSKKVENLIYKYVSFLSNAQKEDGTFRNSMGYNREFLEEEVPEECFGRCLGALCYAYSDNNTPLSIKKAVRDLIDKALPNCMKRTSSRAIAYVIIGLNYLDEEKTNGYISKLAALLADHYMHYKNDTWLWFEDSLTCCNAALPRALLTAFKVTKEARYLKVGLESLQFLEGKTFTEGYFRPIGKNGLQNSENEAFQFDEQTLEASEATSAYIEAFLVTNNIEYIAKAKTCFLWYVGKNSRNLTLLDDETGGCYDGIEIDRLNPNQSAVSIISFWTAYLEIKKYLKQVKTI